MRAIEDIAEPLPDEICRGHAGRLRHRNRLRDLASLTKALRVQIGSPDLSLASTIARLCGMSPLEYVQLHTMTPFMACVVPGKVNLKMPWSESTLRRIGAATPREDAYLCPLCVKEDETFWGFSYWRRSHQLPGFSECQKHGTPLSYVQGWEGFDRLPSHWLKTEGSTTICEPHLASPAVERFREAANALLELKAPFSADTFVRTLNAQARRQGVSVSGRCEGRQLSSLAHKCFEHSWLNSMFASRTAWSPKKRFEPIDGAIRASAKVTGAAYCVAISTLFASVSDGLQMVEDPGSRPNHTPTRRNVNVRARYYHHEGDIELLAKEYDCNAGQLRRSLTRKRRSLLEHEGGASAKRILGRFLAGDDLLAACATEGASIRLIQNLLRLYLTDLRAPLAAHDPKKSISAKSALSNKRPANAPTRTAQKTS